MKKLLFAAIIIISVPLFAGERNWEVYFTTPGRTAEGHNTPGEALARAIRSSTRSFHGAFYDISSMKIADELIAAHGRGVEVKLVTDTDTYSGEVIDRIVDSGIPVVTDESSGLMHNKFAIIDGCSVYTGSTNATDNCTSKNNNNSILVRSEELAGIYEQEFEEMFEQRIFGNRKENGAFTSLSKKYYARVDDININAYFSPEDNIERIISKRIKKAKRSIRFMAFSFTSDSLGELMIDKFREGVSVEGIFEKRGSGSEYSEFTKMFIEGVPVARDSNPHVMHHKVIIIDDSVVITGSYNFSKNAGTRNDENVLIIESGEITSAYTEEFRRLYHGGAK